MNERAVQFWVGVMVVSTGLIASILVLLLGNKPAMFEKTYPIQIEFADAPGVTENTPIRRSGILIGRVKKVQLLTSGMVHVTAGIHQADKLPANSRCKVRSTLLGDAEIEFYIPAGMAASEKTLPAGATIREMKSTDPLAAVANLQEGVAQAIDAVTTAGNKLDETLGKINVLLDKNEQHIDSIFQRTDQTLQLVQDTATFTRDLTSDPDFRRQFKEEFEQLPETLRNTREAVAQMRTTMNNMDRTMGLVDDNLRNIKNFTEPLGANGQQIAKNFDESVLRLNQVMMEVESFSKAINSRHSTIGCLTQNDELYQRLNRTMCNIEEISYRLKPIVNDVRIISDRLARHPGSILRDAVRPGPGIKGLPPANWDPADCAGQPSTWTR